METNAEDPIGDPLLSFFPSAECIPKDIAGGGDCHKKPKEEGKIGKNDGNSEHSPPLSKTRSCVIAISVAASECMC